MHKFFYKFYAGEDNDEDDDDYDDEDNDDDDNDDYFNENDDSDDEDDDDDNDIIIPGNPMIAHKSPHPHIKKIKRKKKVTRDYTKVIHLVKGQ